MAFYAYILRCSDSRYYAGSTDDLETRVAQHQAGQDPSCYTFKRRPVSLAWSDSFATRIEAKEAEARIKGWSRAKKEALIAGDWDAVSLLAAIGRAERFIPSFDRLRTSGWCKSAGEIPPR